jgi:hypothetical protein
MLARINGIDAVEALYKPSPESCVNPGLPATQDDSLLASACTLSLDRSAPVTAWNVLWNPTTPGGQGDCDMSLTGVATDTE